MNFSLSRAVDLATDVGVSQFSVKSVHYACLCLEVTGSSKHLVLRLSKVSSFDLLCAVSQRYLFVWWSWWHPGLIVCVLSLDWCSGPADDELGSDGRSAGGTAWFPSNLLGMIAPARNFGKSLVGTVCNNFGVTRRLAFLPKQQMEMDLFFGSMKKWSSLITTATFQHITHGSSCRHISPTTIRMHDIVRLTVPSTGRCPCPMKWS